MAICIMENVEFGATPQLTHGLDMSAAGWVTLPCQLASSQLKERNCCCQEPGILLSAALRPDA